MEKLVSYKNIEIKKENVFQHAKHEPEIFKIIDSIAHPFAAGTFYYFIHYYASPDFHFVSDSLKNILGYEMKDFTPEFLSKILHPDDLEKLSEKELMSLSFFEKQIPVEAISSYKVAFLIRIKHANGKYLTILHQARPITVSDDGEILETVSVHTDVSYLNASVDHKVSFITKKKRSYLALDSNQNQLISGNCFIENFSARELEIIKCAGLGMNVHETADKLFLSPHTVITHKKNILRKSKCKNFTQLVANCIKGGIV